MSFYSDLKIFWLDFVVKEKGVVAQILNKNVKLINDDLNWPCKKKKVWENAVFSKGEASEMVACTTDASCVARKQHRSLRNQSCVLCPFMFEKGTAILKLVLMLLAIWEPPLQSSVTYFIWPYFICLTPKRFSYCFDFSSYGKRTASMNSVQKLYKTYIKKKAASRMTVS